MTCERIAELEKALMFYADERNYRVQKFVRDLQPHFKKGTQFGKRAVILTDNGMLARKVLGIINRVKK